MDIMKIREAQTQYSAKGQECINKDYRNLVRVVQQNHLSISIPNIDYSHALYLSEEMFNNANYSIRILSGKAGDGFLITLANPFERAAERIARNKGLVHIILLNDSVPQIFNNLKEKYGESFQWLLASGPEDINHFITCDSRMLRYEKPHRPLTPDDDIEAIQADVYFDNTIKTKAVEEYFDVIWNHCSKTTSK